MSRSRTLTVLSWVVLGLVVQVSASGQESKSPDAQLALEKALRARLESPLEGPLDIDLIMLGELFSGTKPSSVAFSADGQELRFHWRAPGEEEEGRYVHALSTGTLRRLPDDEVLEPGHEARHRVVSGEVEVYRHEDTVWLRRGEAEAIALLPEIGGLRLRGLNGAGDEVVLAAGDDLYAFHLAGRGLRRLTRIESAKAEAKKDARAAFLEGEELALFLHVHEEAEAEKKRDERREQREKLAAYELPRGFRAQALDHAPDLERVLVILSKPGSTTRTRMPRYINASGYVDDFDARPKVGDSSSKSGLALIDTTSGREVPVKLEDVIPFEDYSVGRRGFAPDSSRLAVVLRSRDNKKAAIVEIDRAGAARLLHLVEDEAWVRHVGDDLGFLRDGRLYFSSEKSGFNHLYIEVAVGGEFRQRTEGAFLVDDVQYRPDLDRFLLRTSRQTPASRQLEWHAPDGEPDDFELIFDLPGLVMATLDPAGEKLALVYSGCTKPHELYLRDLHDDPKSLGKAITDSPSPAFHSRAWIEPEFGSFEARDGVQVPFRLYRPTEPRPGGRAVIFVHGAGYLQNVHRGWSGYFREYLFHNLLVERGYVVLDVDYRGSAGYGRDWRCAIYRHMGGKDLTDQLDAAAFLAREQGIDPGRIGIYGGSYGGFITLMALFTAPGTFQAGAALRPVTDWAHYNHGYTSNILNSPQDDPEAFRRSSPIHFAEGLEDRLLICHGLEDDNVQPQDSLRLVQRLIELRKTGWELALYPVEPHGFREPQSWADEYKRILALFEATL